MIINLLSSVIATLITVPIIAFFIIYFISQKLTRNKKRSFHITVDLSTFLFIIAVNYLASVIWEQSFLWLILAVITLTAMIFIFLNWKFTDELQLSKVFKGFWRLNFLLFVSVYLLLFIYGLIARIVTFT